MIECTFTSADAKDNHTKTPVGLVTAFRVGEQQVAVGREADDGNVLQFPANELVISALMRGVEAYRSSREQRDNWFSCASFVAAATTTITSTSGRDGWRYEICDKPTLDVDTDKLRVGRLVPKHRDPSTAPPMEGHWMLQLPDQFGTVLHVLGPCSPLVLSKAGDVTQRLFPGLALYEAIPPAVHVHVDL